MGKKIAIFAFNGEPMCFAHALMNAIDMKEKGHDIKLIIEGSATKNISDLMDPAKPFSSLYMKVKKAGLMDCVCRACAQKMDSLESAKEQGLRLCDEMFGHPSMARYVEEGYEIIVV
ncbi:DsrE family protein [Methanomethylovorans sp.]|uniref:DsrE family protein n=1 Tax=Methanomethylovorans sp. TaxID=2758717 RepID=UPI000B175DC4|nr:DsrE family protein [Methanomethylovorans sp.]